MASYPISLRGTTEGVEGEVKSADAAPMVGRNVFVAGIRAGEGAREATGISGVSGISGEAGEAEAGEAGLLEGAVA